MNELSAPGKSGVAEKEYMTEVAKGLINDVSKASEEGKAQQISDSDTKTEEKPQLAGSANPLLDKLRLEEAKLYKAARGLSTMDDTTSKGVKEMELLKKAKELDEEFKTQEMGVDGHFAPGSDENENDDAIYKEAQKLSKMADGEDKGAELDGLLEKAKKLDSEIHTNGELQHVMKQLPASERPLLKKAEKSFDNIIKSEKARQPKSSSEEKEEKPAAASTSSSTASKVASAVAHHHDDTSFALPAFLILCLLASVAGGVAFLLFQRSAKVGDTVNYAKLSTEDHDVGDIGYLKDDSDAESDLGLEDADYMARNIKRPDMGLDTARPISDAEWPSPLAESGQTPSRFPPGPNI